MSRRFDRFIDTLAAVEVTGRACNQYSRISGDLGGNAIRRRNLRLYLSEMDVIAPDTLLIGEAVSYRGGRLSGVAFVSEALMLGGVSISTAPGHVLGAGSGYRRATHGPRLSTEASATMVWETIAGMVPLPMLWNAFPFHPFAGGDPDTNRAPTSVELQAGSEFIEWLLRLFPIQQVVAIGNHAGSSLSRLGIEHVKVRHPSQGGKHKFVDGMARLTQGTRS